MRKQQRLADKRTKRDECRRFGECGSTYATPEAGNVGRTGHQCRQTACPAPYFTGVGWAATGLSALNDAGTGLDSLNTWTTDYLDVRSGPGGFVYARKPGMMYGEYGRPAAFRVDTMFRKNTALISTTTKLRYVSKGGGALAVVGGVLTYYDEVESGHSEAEAAVAAGASVAGGFGGAWAGAQAGAVVGSFFGPVGTVVGAGVGALVGGFVGSEFGKSAVNEVWSWFK